MAQLVADRRDIDFVLYEQFGAQSLTKHPKYTEFTRKTLDLIITEARAFALKEILPTYTQGDREGVRLENGQVKAPECFREPYRKFIEGEWTALVEDPELGGQGLPHTVAMAANEYLVGTNFAFAGYTSMAHGAGKMIELYGTDLQKQMFLKNLYTGHWAGTMMLTEPEAGSDVGALTTTARPNDDGTYTITGNKLFITSGDHDLAENIIHPVLARIEGAPAGTRGISLFIVPKFWVQEDGSLGEFNDVVCTGVEEKMGIHGSATCAMALGGKGQCRGLLLGEAHKGMRAMFHMMNEARLAVGLQAFSHASAAYLYAANYAKERIQGRDLADMLKKEAPSVPIIRHPDVRRMLTWMKTYVEGMRSFLYFIANYLDRIECTADAAEKEACQGFVELMTPIVKTYNAKYGFEVCVQAIQTYGGYGYTSDFPVEQLARDCKIASIYEGTDGIQAMDLLARKIGMKQGAVFQGFIAEIGKSIESASGIEALAPMAQDLKTACDRLLAVAMNLGMAAMSPNFKAAFGQAVPFLDIMGDVIMAWMLLWRACIASQNLGNDAPKKDQAFYAGQIKSAEFFFSSVLPVTLGKMAACEKLSPAALEIDEAAFGG